MLFPQKQTINKTNSLTTYIVTTLLSAALFSCSPEKADDTNDTKEKTEQITVQDTSLAQPQTTENGEKKVYKEEYEAIDSLIRAIGEEEVNNLLKQNSNLNHLTVQQRAKTGVIKIIAENGFSLSLLENGTIDDIIYNIPEPKEIYNFYTDDEGNSHKDPDLNTRHHNDALYKSQVDNLNIVMNGTIVNLAKVCENKLSNLDSTEDKKEVEE